MNISNLELLVPQEKTREPTRRRGKVISNSLVLLDNEDEPITPTDWLVVPVVGSFVRVRFERMRAIVEAVEAGTTGTAPTVEDFIPENSILVGRRWYQASGVQPCPSYKWGYSGSDWVATTLYMPLPYKPPAGYGFAYSILTTSGFTIAQTGQPTGNNTQVRLFNYKHSAPIIGSLQWQLVKQS